MEATLVALTETVTALFCSTAANGHDVPCI